jgi:hypothetical protein
MAMNSRFIFFGVNSLIGPSFHLANGENNPTRRAALARPVDGHAHLPALHG